MKKTRIDFQRFLWSPESFVKSLNGLARGNSIVASLHKQNGAINRWIIHDLLGGPYCFEIEPDRDEVMKQTEIFERIQMSSIMRQIRGIQICGESKSRQASIKQASQKDLPARRYPCQTQPRRAGDQTG
jgi:hypothetical protein